MLDAGTLLGPYRITAPLDAGGMGEVYRARDTRLERDVAIKVILAEYAGDRARQRRFEQEARVASALNHPSIISLYDFGMHEGAPYVVMELLEGESLRSRLGHGPIPLRKVLEYGAQAARGLAAAHAKGIVHRDLKPENLFLTREGRVKILDFGLAKLSRPEVSDSPDGSTVTKALTSAGTILGTVGYMSPEQVRGEPADHRSDLFSLGTILHEMVTGERAFRGESSVETLNAILKEEPGPLSVVGREVPPAVEGIIRHCLEKNPEERFQSARDLAFALEGQGGISAVSGVGLVAPAQKRAAVWRRSAFVAVAAVVAVAAASAATFLWTRRTVRRPVPVYSPVTSRRGNVEVARFAPDGKAVIYSASWEDDAKQTFFQRLGVVDARSLDLPGSMIVAAVGNEMAVILQSGTLARVPIDGGTPREEIEQVAESDWSADGSKYVIKRTSPERSWLECPPGKVLYDPGRPDAIRDPRLSPKGDHVAFFEASGAEGSSGDVVVVDLSGRKRVLSKDWERALGLAWSPDGGEIWFTAAKVGVRRALYAVTLSGKERLVERTAGDLCLQDVNRDGSALVTLIEQRSETWGRMAGDSTERNVSWLDGTSLALPSPDGTRMVFEESGDGGGTISAAYLRRMDGSAPVRLADGEPLAVSPDWKWVICRTGYRYPENGLKRVPVGAGETVTLPRGAIHDVIKGWWHPDGRRFLFWGVESGKPGQWYIQDIPDGVPQPLLPGVKWAQCPPFTPDGQFVVGQPSGGGPLVLYPVEGGEPRPILGLQANEEALCWSEDGRYLFVALLPAGISLTRSIVRLDTRTGYREPWLELVPPDRVGVVGIGNINITPDGRYYTYSYVRTLSQLFVVSGLK